MKRAITTLVFDLGGVLTRQQDPARVREIMDILGLDGELDRFRAAYFAHREDYDRGLVDARGYWRTVCATLGVAFPEARVPEILGRDLDSWFRYRPGMIAALPGLRARVSKMALLSNIHLDGIVRLRSSFPRLELFDRLVLSAELRQMKPERAIYESCLEALGSPPGETLFVDDVPANIEGARAAGLAGLRFIDEEQFFEELEAFFELRR